MNWELEEENIFLGGPLKKYLFQESSHGGQVVQAEEEVKVDVVVGRMGGKEFFLGPQVTQHKAKTVHHCAQQ